jgi:hypothetical protein
VRLGAQIVSDYDMDDKEQPRIFHERKRTLEQNIITIISGLTMAILIWEGTTLITMTSELSGYKVEMRNLADKFATRLEIETIRLELQRIKDEQERRKAFIPGYQKPFQPK